MDNTLLGEVAKNLNKERDDVSAVIDEFMLQLHRRLYEYKGLNGDYIGEELSLQIENQAFFHFLCFLNCFIERYDWDDSSAGEYLGRLGRLSDWIPYRHQTEGWIERSK
ncbi:MAG: hypothetical protein VB050_04885 [Geobacteraceae bacterium]|nr:hypothetical protein [Geobacteraceae bacterium]